MVINLFRMADMYAMMWTQAVYDFIRAKTGAYVGTMMIVCQIIHAIGLHLADDLKGPAQFFIVLNLLLAAWFYYQQMDPSNHLTFNLRAMQMALMPLRKYIILINVVLVSIYVSIVGIVEILVYIPIFLMLYLMTVILYPNKYQSPGKEGI